MGGLFSLTRTLKATANPFVELVSGKVINLIIQIHLPIIALSTQHFV